MMTIWVVLGLSGIIVCANGDLRDAIWVASVNSVLLGVYVFWSHGGRQITVAGVYSIGPAIFVGFAGIYLLIQPDDPTVNFALFKAISLAYFAHLASYGLFWLNPIVQHVPRSPGSGSAASWGIKWGMILLVAGSAAASSGILSASIGQAAAFTGATLLTVSLTARSARPGKLSAWQALAIILAFLVYVTFDFTGGGRLVVVGLGAALATVASTQVRGHRMKLVMLLAVVPALLIFGSIRYTSGIAAGDTAINYNGLGSVVSPLQTFSTLLTRNDEGNPLPRGHGGTFVATAVSQVPRSLWPDKPAGFGAVLTEQLYPTLVGIHLSLAALSPGEWFYNFGYPGLVLMAVVVGFLIRRIDLWLITLMSLRLDRRRRLLALTIAGTLAGGILDLFWVGSFTFAARTVPRLFFIAVLGLLARER